jgi:hypothetical protein
LAFGVVGSASGELDPDVVVSVRRLGAAIAGLRSTADGSHAHRR